MLIGILTFHAAHNYGSMLQAYALQQYLFSRGYDNEIINYRPASQQRLYPHPLKSKVKFINLITPIWLCAECNKWQKFESFLKNYMVLSEKQYDNAESLKRDLAQYDAIIVGGDQIWNFNCRDFEDVYYLHALSGPFKKISYAPSFGRFLDNLHTQPNQIRFIKSTLSDFDCLSVREILMKDYLKCLLGKCISVVADPVFLLSSEHYAQIIGNRPLIKGSYLFYYSPYTHSEAEDYAVQLGKRFNLKVVTTAPHRLRRKGMHSVFGAGPITFLTLLKNATLVVGQSYHLVAFSLLFHKSFSVFDPKDTRISSLINFLDLTDDAHKPESRDFLTIDFSHVDNRLELLKTASCHFLEHALSFQ